MLAIAPLLGLCLSIWALGNRQMFDNVVDAITTDGQIILSHHLIGNWDHMLPDYTHVHMLFIGLIVSTGVIVSYSLY